MQRAEAGARVLRIEFHRDGMHARGATGYREDGTATKIEIGVGTLCAAAAGTQRRLPRRPASKSPYARHYTRTKTRGAG
jgi:hypothetical protein